MGYVAVVGEKSMQDATGEGGTAHYGGAVSDGKIIIAQVSATATCMICFVGHLFPERLRDETNNI